MRLIPFLLALTCLFAPASFAQAPAASTAVQPAVPSCDGIPATVRVSEIKPGSMPVFLQAVAAHQAWYRAHGSADPIFATRIQLHDPLTKALSYSETEVLTFHLVPDPNQHLAEGDDAWKAFVAMYKDSSTIKSEYLVCMPKLMP